MIMNAMRLNQDYVDQCPIIDIKSNANTTKFFDLLKNSNKSSWDGCINHRKLLVVA